MITKIKVIGSEYQPENQAWLMIPRSQLNEQAVRNLLLTTLTALNMGLWKDITEPEYTHSQEEKEEISK